MNSTEANPSAAVKLTAAVDDDGYPLSVLGSELLFTLLPFTVLLLVHIYQGKGAQAFLLAPEWAFASATLFGQTIVKFVHGVVASSRNANTIAERVALFVALLIVFGLVPSMIVLALVLVSPAPPAWLGYAQISLCLVAVLSFLLLGAVAHSEASKARNAPLRAGA